MCERRLAARPKPAVAPRLEGPEGYVYTDIPIAQIDWHKARSKRRLEAAYMIDMEAAGCR